MHPASSALLVLLVLSLAPMTPVRGSEGSPLAAPSGGSERSVLADFNQDGFGDLAVGAAEENVGPLRNAGGVHVIYGSPTGLSATGTQFLTQDTPGVQDVAERDDGFGAALVGADFNGDGFADLAIGAPFEDIGIISEAGAVNVIYGSENGLSATATPDQLWHRNTPGVNGKAGADDLFGQRLAAANFGGGPQADLAVGVPSDDFNGTDTGAVNVIYGSPGGLSATATPDQLWSQDSPVVQGVADDGDSFGWSLAAANFGGGPEADLAIGVPANLSGLRTGAVNVIYGSPEGLSATVIPNQLWSQATSDVEGVADDGDRFGQSLVAANFGRSSHADLAVGVPFDDDFTGLRTGAVNVIYGSPEGLSARVTPDQLWGQDRPDVEGVSEEGDRFGDALAAANFGGGPQADLAVGVPYDDFNATETGVVNVIYGSPGGLSATATPDQLWSQDSPDVEGVAEDSDHFGWSLAAANFGGGPQADLAVGVPYDDLNARDTGTVNVIYGSPGGLSATATPDQSWSQESLGTGEGTEPRDLFGYGLAAVR